MYNNNVTYKVIFYHLSLIYNKKTVQGTFIKGGKKKKMARGGESASKRRIKYTHTLTQK